MARSGHTRKFYWPLIGNSDVHLTRAWAIQRATAKPRWIADPTVRTAVRDVQLGGDAQWQIFFSKFLFSTKGGGAPLNPPTYNVLTLWIMQVSALPVIRSAFSFANTDTAPVWRWWSQEDYINPFCLMWLSDRYIRGGAPLLKKNLASWSPTQPKTNWTVWFHRRVVCDVKEPARSKPNIGQYHSSLSESIWLRP